MADELPPNTGDPSDPSSPSPVVPVPPAATAGSLLRQAREARGLHIGALAASLKIPQRKLEALERDRLEDLPDAAFARALAITVCRALKTDSAPVLALLPRANAGALDHVSPGLNQPFREHAAGEGMPALSSVLRHPSAVIVMLLLVAALAVWLWPRSLPEAVVADSESAVMPPSLPDALPPALLPATPAPMELDAAASQAAAADTAVAVISEAAGPDTAAPAALEAQPADDAAAPVAAATLADSSDALLAIRVQQDTWVQVVDGTDRILLSRTVAAGTTVTADGVLPLQLIIGNAGSAELRFRGQAVDLGPATTGNVARLQLK
jgi:cytoskeleton protein RodZ